MLSGMLKVSPMRNESIQDVIFYMFICDFQKAGERKALATEKTQRKKIHEGIYRVSFLNYLKLTC